MAVQIIVTDFEKRGPTVRVEVSHSVAGGGHGYTFMSMEDVTRFCDLFLNPDVQTALAFVLTSWKARDPNLNNPALVLNRTLEIDFTSTTPIRVV